MATLKHVYSAFQSIPTTLLNSLASGASAALVQVNNETDAYLDVSIGGLLTFGAGAVAQESVQILVAAKWGENAADIGGGGHDRIPAAGAAGTNFVNDATQEYVSANVRLLDVVSFGAVPPVTGENMEWGPVSLAMVFGHMPVAWSIIVNLEQSTAPLSSSGHRVEWRGMKLTDA